MTVFGIGARELYDAVLTRDRRFDGRMFVGVRSTRIYCRPICTVRPPRFENCSFYRQAATAEAAGFRPCLRCRPELAPGSTAPVDAVSRLAALAIRRIEDGALSELNLDELAAEFGVTARHLRRAIRQEAGLTPVELAQTQRLLSAKQLLTDTKMTVTEAAFAAGFESLRRFNTAFKQRYRLTPTSLRRSAAANKVEVDDAYRFNLGVRPPFDLAPLLAFWETRATPGVEQVADGWYRRTAVVGDRTGWAASALGGRTIRFRFWFRPGWVRFCRPSYPGSRRCSTSGRSLSESPSVSRKIRCWRRFSIAGRGRGYRECSTGSSAASGRFLVNRSASARRLREDPPGRRASP